MSFVRTCRSRLLCRSSIWISLRCVSQVYSTRVLLEWSFRPSGPADCCMSSCLPVLAVGSYYGRLETKIVPRTALRHRYGNWTLEEWRVLFGMACLSGPSHLLQQLYQSFDCFPRYPLPLSNQSGTHWLRAPQLFLLKSMTTTNSSFVRLRFSTNAAYASNNFYHFG